MSFQDLIRQLQATPLSTEIRESDWIFPSLESLHVIAFVLVVGTIAVVDLRLIGVASRRRSAEELLRELLPLTWSAFAVTFIAGALLFISKPITYTQNFFFLGKMVLILLAGLNMAVFQIFIHKTLIGRPAGGAAPIAARISGGLSLLLWTLVVAFGRWIGFTTT